jgi:hypothetical protein
MDKMTGRPRGFAFVTMGTADEAKPRLKRPTAPTSAVAPDRQ